MNDQSVRYITDEWMVGLSVVSVMEFFDDEGSHWRELTLSNGLRVQTLAPWVIIHDDDTRPHAEIES